MTNTDSEISPLALTIYNYRTSHNLQGSAKTDWREADYLITQLKLEDKMRREGYVMNE